MLSRAEPNLVSAHDGHDCAALYVQCQPHVDRAVGRIARRFRLGSAEAEDLAGVVRLKLLKNDYEALRRYQGRSSLHTYIAVIAERVLMDQRTAEWGRWRPCIRARRAGPEGVLLDRLLNRDGLPFDAACDVMRRRFGAAMSTTDLERLSATFAVRSGRQFVEAGVLEQMPDDSTPESDFAEAETARARDVQRRRLGRALRELSPYQRRLLRLRYKDGLGVADIARLLDVKQQRLYRQFDGLLAELRRRLAGPGLTA